MVQRKVFVCVCVHIGLKLTHRFSVTANIRVCIWLDCVRRVFSKLRKILDCISKIIRFSLLFVCTATNGLNVTTTTTTTTATAISTNGKSMYFALIMSIIIKCFIILEKKTMTHRICIFHCAWIGFNYKSVPDLVVFIHSMNSHIFRTHILHHHV